jgi:hypothetical protein
MCVDYIAGTYDFYYLLVIIASGLTYGITLWLTFYQGTSFFIAGFIHDIIMQIKSFAYFSNK